MKNWQTLDGKPPRIIAHRGASGLRPEHTLEAYQLAIDQGADIIEPDLVPSRDGVLMARHERGLSRSTNVASQPEFFARYTVDENGHHEWLTDDFSVEHISRLRAIQPFPGRSKAFDGQFVIPTFADVIAVARAAQLVGRPIGVYPEIKHPTDLMMRGIDSTALLIATLRSEKLEGAQSPVWVQCFELEPLRRIYQDCGNPVFALFDIPAIGASQWLRSLRLSAPWLSGIAVPKLALIGAHGRAELVRVAHDLGWQIHVWTLRDDSVMSGFTSVQEEYSALFELGVDALFCDFPASAIAARALFIE